MWLKVIVLWSAVLLGCQTPHANLTDDIVGPDGRFTTFVLVRHQAPDFFAEGYLDESDTVRSQQLAWQLKAPYLALVQCAPSARPAVASQGAAALEIRSGPKLVTREGAVLDCEVAPDLIDAFSAFHFLSRQQIPDLSRDATMLYLATRGGFRRDQPGYGVYESALFRLAVAEMNHGQQFPGGQRRAVELERLKDEFQEIDNKLNPCLSAFPLDHFECVRRTADKLGVFHFAAPGPAAGCEDTCIYQPKFELPASLVFEELSRIGEKTKRRTAASNPSVKKNELSELASMLHKSTVNWVDLSGAADRFLSQK